MFSVSGLSLIYSAKVIFDDVSFVINPRDKIGLIGKNGIGKTTLLNVIAGFTKTDNGNVAIPEGKVIGYLPQMPEIGSDTTVFKETIKTFDEILLENQIELKNISKKSSQ